MMFKIRKLKLLRWKTRNHKNSNKSRMKFKIMIQSLNLIYVMMICSNDNQESEYNPYLKIRII